MESRGLTNEVQTVQLENVQGGRFRLEFAGQTSEWIDRDADASAVQRALRTIPTIGFWNGRVTGNAGGAWDVQFQGNLSGQDLPLLIVDSSELIGGAAITRTVAEGGAALDGIRDAIEGGKNGYFRIYRRGNTNEELTVRYIVSAGSTATAGVDYRLLTGTVVIPAGAESANIRVRTNEDTAVESLENVQITLADPFALPGFDPNYRLGAAKTGTVSIFDNDFAGARPTVSISSWQDSSEEGQVGYVRVTRSEAASAPLVVSYQVSPNSSASANDYESLAGTVTIPAGATFADIVITSIDDFRSEGDETVIVSLTGADQLQYLVTTGSPAEVAILDDEPVFDPDWPVVAFAERVNTQEGGQPGKFRFSRTGNLAQSLTVGYAINELNAFAAIGEDFQYTPGTSSSNPILGQITFATGQADAEITISTLNDSQPEYDEAVYVRLLESSSDAYRLGIRFSGTLWIADDDQPLPGPSVSAISLVQDTGASAMDKVTYDPRVNINLAGTFSAPVTKVLFDHDRDFVVDGEITVSTPGGPVQYDPRTSDTEFENTLGQRTLSYQVVSYDSFGEAIQITAWGTFSFQYVENVEIGGVRLVGVRLERDTGVEDDDLVTANPTLVGAVYGDLAGGLARIEFDHDGDEWSDGAATVTQSGQQFRYDPRASDPSLAEHEGAFLIQYRLVYVDGQAQETPGAWTAVELTLETVPASQFAIESLAVTAGTAELDDGEQMLGGQVTLPPPEPNPDPSSEPSNAPPAANAASPAFAQVEIDFDDDGVVDARVTADFEGRFRYPLGGIGYGEFTARIRAVEWSPIHSAELYGQWATVTFSLTPEPAPDVLELATSDSYDATGHATNLVIVIGRIGFTRFDVAGILVQFDHDEDGLIDGEAIVAADGTFRYTPRHLELGDFNMRARASRWDSVIDDEITGAWASLNVHVASIYVPAISSLHLLLDTGENNADGITHVSTLSGQLGDASVASSVEIQFDHDGDNDIDGYVSPQDNGSFVYDPLGLAVGVHTVRARAVRWDENQVEMVFSDWTPITLELVVVPNNPVTVSQLGVLVRTGGDETSPVTNVSTLVGRLQNDGGTRYLKVEFDHDVDGDVDGSTVSDASGDFWYSPANLPMGAATVAARAVEWNDAQQHWIVGPWTTLSFTLEAAHNVPPIVEELALLSDSGSSATDGNTANATLAGSVADDRSPANLTVEFDHDGDDLVDGVAITDADGNFYYEPVALELGPVSMRARVVEWNPLTSAYQRGPWASIDFEYETQTDAPADLADVQLADPLADANPTRHSLRGRVRNEGTLQDIAVEFDFDGDGQVDQSAVTDAFGRFAVQPGGLAFGNVTIHARTRETNPTTHQMLVSSWSEWSFEYAAIGGLPAEVVELDLLNSSGGNTADPRVTGELDHSGLGAYVVVQFDHNEDNIPDGQVVAGSNLEFAYRPVGLSVGEVTLRARTKDYDRNGGAVFGQWFTLQFNLTELTDHPLVISNLHLSNDTGESATDGSSDDAALAGTLTGHAANEGVTIEIDEDGDGTVDSTTGINSEGTFGFTPGSVTAGLNTVYVRTVTSSTSGGRSSDWTSFSFVYSDEPDGAAAQDFVPVAASLNASAAAAQSGYRAAVEAAEVSHRQQKAIASQAYDDAVGDAIGTRNNAVNGATVAYDAAVRTADAAYVVALQAAAAALAVNLANFGGDSTSFDLTPFEWPQAPAENRARVPEDATQPRPPQTGPQYSGPEFLWHSDQVYLAAKGGFDLAYDAAIHTAEANLRQAKRDAQETYDQSAREANDVFRVAVADAEEAYRETLRDNSTAPFDLQYEYQAHQDRLQSAWDTYDSALRDQYEAHQAGAGSAPGLGCGQ